MADDASSSDAAVRALTQKLRHPILDIRERALAAVRADVRAALLVGEVPYLHAPVVARARQLQKHAHRG